MTRPQEDMANFCLWTSTPIAIAEKELRDCWHCPGKEPQHGCVQCPFRMSILTTLEEWPQRVFPFIPSHTTNLPYPLCRRTLLLWGLQRKWNPQALREYVLCQNTLINTKEITGRLYYKTHMEICSTVHKSLTFQDTLTREDCAVKMLLYRSKEEIQPNGCMNLNIEIYKMKIKTQNDSSFLFIFFRYTW